MCSRILCSASAKFNILNPTKLGRTELQESDPSKAAEIMMLSMESHWMRVEHFPRIHNVVALWQNQWSAEFISTNTRNFHRNSIMSMFNDISCDKNDNKDEYLKNAESVKVLARRFGIGQWSFSGPGSLKHDHNWIRGNDLTQCKKLVLSNIVILHLRTRTSSTYLRRAERDGESISWRQRSQLDSADRESPWTTSISKWSSTTSSIQSFQQRITRCD